MEDINSITIHVDDEEKNLYISRTENIKSEALSPCCMTIDDVDYEMSKGKNKEILQICGMNQESFEYFIKKYGHTYRYLYFFKCQLIFDFSLLSTLENLERVDIYWNIRATNLWDFSKNYKLKTLIISDAKRLIFNPNLLQTSSTLENVILSGSVFTNYPMESLKCFANMPNLKYLNLNSIRLNDKDMSTLNTLSSLVTFDFDAGMLTTEEIAWIVAKYPHISGKCLCAYNTEDAFLNDVRVCGFRKPGLDLPQQHKRLDKYIQEFNNLVEKYRNEN